MYSGYFVNVTAKGLSAQRFVTPAIVKDVIADMVGKMMDEDPQDEFVVTVKWGQDAVVRPEYVTRKESENG